MSSNESSRHNSESYIILNNNNNGLSSSGTITNTTNTSGGEALPYLFTQGDYPGLDFDKTEDKPVNELILKEDIYKNCYFNQEHLNFIGTDKQGSVVISVLPKTSDYGKYPALLTTAKGSDPIEVRIAQGDYEVEVSIEKALKQYSPILVTDPEFPSEFVLLEQKHQQKRSVMKIGLAYCRKGQTLPQEMFLNGRNNDAINPKFWQFLNLLGERVEITDNWKKYRGDMRPPGTAYYTEWKHVEVIFHVAPILNDEETRRLIGNDIVMLIFVDENCTFNPTHVDKFGEVPQAFVVVQPTGSDKYKVGFFRKKNLLAHGPNSASSPLDGQATKELILCKLYNGLVMTSYCPPMNRLFWKPRQDTLELIVTKFRNKIKNKLPTKSGSTTPMKDVMLTKKLTNNPINTLDPKVTFVPTSGYSHINSMVLLVASNLAYEEGDKLKEYATLHLGFGKDHVIRDRSAECYFYVAVDLQKFFIVFRGIPDVERSKKYLSKTKKSKLYLKKQDITLPGEIFADYVKILTLIMDRIEEIITQKFFGSPQQFYLTGHDIGGALAILVAHVLSFTYQRDIGAVYAFGSPKVGDPTWSKSYPDWLAQKTFRVSHENDFISSLPSKDWAHVGIHVPPEGSTGLVANPHSVESYFKSLAPAHAAAVGEQNDRISIKSQNILQNINQRETIKLDNFTLEVQDADASSETEIVDQNSRYEIRPATPNLVRTGTPTSRSQGTSSAPSFPPQIPSVTSGSGLCGSGVSISGGGGGGSGGGSGNGERERDRERERERPPAGAGRRTAPNFPVTNSLVAPDILQQIRNNVYVLMSNMKLLYGIVFNGSSGDFNTILGTVNVPMKNLMIIMGLITSNNSVVQELALSIHNFLKMADQFFLMVGDRSVPLEEVERAWTQVLPTAKDVGVKCANIQNYSS